MKITRTTPVQALQSVKPAADKAGASSSSEGKDKVTLSADAAFVQRARETAKQPEVRSDLVAEVKAQLASGTFEQSVDMDATASSLLADL